MCHLHKMEHSLPFHYCKTVLALVTLIDLHVQTHTNTHKVKKKTHYILFLHACTPVDLR